MKIILGTDHGGFELKEKIKKWLVEQKYEVSDVGAAQLEKEDDFVDYATLVAEELAGDDSLKGILFCRNGFGMSIAANRYPGVRCGQAFDKEAVRKGRADDDINCLSIPADYLDFDKTKEVIEIFLKTEFSGEERYKRRLWKLEMIGASGGGCCGGGCCSGDGGCGEC